MYETLQSVILYPRGECALSACWFWYSWVSIILLRCQDLGVPLWQCHCLSEWQVGPLRCSGKKHTCSAILWEKTVVGNGKGRKQDYGAHTSAESLTAAHVAFVSTTPWHHLSEKFLSLPELWLWVSLCVCMYGCMHVCVEARNGCWASLNLFLILS